jgi:hypothetical protein
VAQLVETLRYGCGMQCVLSPTRGDMSLLLQTEKGGTWWRSCLRHCATDVVCSVCSLRHVVICHFYYRQRLGARGGAVG